MSDSRIDAEVNGNNSDLESLLKLSQDTADGNVAPVVETPQPKVNPRPSERERAYNAVDSERDYQDRVVSVAYATAVERLVHMQTYLTNALAAVTATTEEDPDFIALTRIRKIVAIGVKAMEQNGAPQREGYER